MSEKPMLQPTPLLGEIRAQFIENKPRQMIWNGEKWVAYVDVYPLMYFAQTGKPLDLGECKIW